MPGDNVIFVFADCGAWYVYRRRAAEMRQSFSVWRRRGYRRRFGNRAHRLMPLPGIMSYGIDALAARLSANIRRLMRGDGNRGLPHATAPVLHYRRSSHRRHNSEREPVERRNSKRRHQGRGVKSNDNNGPTATMSGLDYIDVELHDREIALARRVTA